LLIDFLFCPDKQKQSSLALSLDPKTKKIVALEANRLSKKSRSYSMYSLHDQLKVNEAADDLSSPYDTEYNREFVNWKEYGTTVREDINKKRQSTPGNHTLKRRGSWSAPSTSLPAPLKWLEDLNLDLGSRVNTREKLQPTITDSRSIRGISTTITAKSRLTRDNNYYDEKRPTTSAEFRDYHYERPTTSADIRDYSRPMTSLNDYNDKDYYSSKHNNNNNNIDYYSYSRKDRNTSPLRSSTTLGHYKDTSDYKDYKDVNDYKDTSKYYDNRERSSGRRDYDYYDDHKYDDRKREDIYDDHKREYDDRRRDNVYDDRRRDNVYDDRQRDNSSYDYEFRRRDDNNHYEDYDSKYNKYNNSRTVQPSDQEHFNPGHSRNTSYASSSNKGSVHDDPINYSGPPLSYLDAVRHRSSVSSLSSVSTPSSPATPIGYDLNDMRWKRNNGLDPRIYKEQYYSPSIISKSSSSSNNKYWQFEDEKDKYYQPSVLSPSRSKFYIDDDEDDDDHIGGYSSKRQSRDYKPSSMRYSSQYSPTPTRSTSPSRDSYGSGRKHYSKSSRPPSRATSVSSHATSIEEESAVLTDLLKEAELMTLKNLTDQMNIFKSRDFGVGIGTKGVANSGRATPAVSGRATPAVSGRATPAVSGRATPAVSGRATPAGRATPSATAAKRSSLGGQKKSTMTTTTTTTRAAGVKSKTTPPTKTSKTGVTTTTTRGIKNNSAPGIPPNKKKTHRPASSLSSISTSSYREAYQPPPPPTNFSAARDALNRARMKVEEMLEIVSNGGSLD
jgi:hypothetical protein